MNTKILLLFTAAFCAGIAVTYTGITHSSTAQLAEVQTDTSGLHSGAVPGAQYVPVAPEPQVIIKEVQVPGPERVVEKIVEVPGPERVVEKIVEVPGPERIVEKVVIKEVRVPVPSKTPLASSGFDIASVALLAGMGATGIRIRRMMAKRK